MKPNVLPVSGNVSHFKIYLSTNGRIRVALDDHVGQNVQLQLFYQVVSDETRVAYDTVADYRIDHSGASGWYYIYVTETGHTANTSYRLRVVYP
ncbi:MAG: hypothetical protein JXA33_25590 [Anaerolineae bacterium]|nr:hypothetical protein [Anaerolineae bacterium]